MTTTSRRIPNNIKIQLINESGGKCANPGCSNIRSEIHHIKHWAVVKTHDAKDMIAVCPTCHDACHNGNLKITDEQLYEWKNIVRRNDKIFAHIYAEPGESPKILAGSLALAQKTERKTIVCCFSESNKFEFSVDEGFLKVTTQLADITGKVILKVKDNNLVMNSDPDIILQHVPGRIVITVPVEKYYLPAYALRMMRNLNPDFAPNNRVVALDLCVVKPGQVRIKGFWTNFLHAMVITEKELCFCNINNYRPTVFTGDGENTNLVYDGPVNLAMFGFS